MKKLTIIVSALVLSASAFASTNTYYNGTTLTTDGFASKQDAYNSGFDMADSLQSMSDKDLKWNLSVVDSTANHITIDNTAVSVEEFAKDRGNIQYRAAVNVSYHYKATESGN